MINRAGCYVRLVVGLALAVAAVAVTRDLAPATQLTLAGLGCGLAVVTVAAFWLASHWRR